MGEEVEIRTAVADDLDAWFALFSDVAAEGRWIGAEAPLDETWAHRSFARTLDSDRAVTLLAHSGHQLVGHLGLTVVGGVAELGMMVRSGHRRQGVGTALVAGAIDWCRGHDVHKIALSVWPHNTGAIALYERFGFTVEGRLVRHHRRADGSLWDVVLMGLAL